MSVILFIRYMGKDIKYDLEPDLPIEQHLGSICLLLSAPGAPSLYGLQIVSTYSFIKQEVTIYVVSSIDRYIYIPQ